MTRLRGLAVLVVLLWGADAAAATVASGRQCSADALQQARRLLAFHVDNDERAEVLPEVEALPSIVNPANSRQRFDVLQVWGSVYKGQYRMRLEYYRSGDSCVLMGQEILEHASL
ncbi:hypothetical protein OK348_12960 [Flavobacterium sp. MXW15]|uniref:DUF2845 domain-containing protein n=1 Tax=Xanthomonas chitinilytica TaxID=2989819 RepID=A0ABT3JWN6_9XANT|nr:hypothetical protein [Xanthomonas sp. H13-6]MCW4455696.1 hypothetical protein [Flavobacterium sp. MXW15]MCW4472912.1 hypothetical protein [Xanthomonas sp. H13-6]